MEQEGAEGRRFNCRASCNLCLYSSAPYSACRQPPDIDEDEDEDNDKDLEASEWLEPRAKTRSARRRTIN